MKNFRQDLQDFLIKLETTKGHFSSQSRCSSAEHLPYVSIRMAEVAGHKWNKIENPEKTMERPHHVKKVIMKYAAGGFSSLSLSLPAQLTAPPPLAYQSLASPLINCAKI